MHAVYAKLPILDTLRTKKPYVSWCNGFISPQIQLSIPLHGAQKQILDVPSGNLLHSY